MNFLYIDDVERIVRLLAAAGDPTVERPIPDRKRDLMHGVAELIDADVWIWTLSALNPEVAHDAMTMQFVDGGWRDDREKAQALDVMFDPVAGTALQARITEIVPRQTHVTLFREEFVAPEAWKMHGDVWLRSGFEQSVFSFYPVDGNIFSGIGFHRRVGRTPFSDRERAIVHLIFSQVEWLHRFGANVPARDTVLELPRRERQVLIYLMGGRTRKEIADCLQLSEHTVGDYIKQLYKRFGVSRRGELLSRFITGGQE